MKAKPIVAVVCVCAAAGVVSWDVKYFLAPSGPVGPETRPKTHMESRADPVAVPVLVVPPQDPAAANDGASRQEPEFAKLFEQLVAQNAARTAEAPETATDPAASPDAHASGATEGWSSLELRGILFGGEHALALVNGRLLREGDELPGVACRIERILADRVIATTGAGRPERALTLHVFESPGRKAGSAATNRTVNNQPVSAPVNAAPAASVGGENPGESSSGAQTANGGNNGGRQ